MSFKRSETKLTSTGPEVLLKLSLVEVADVMLSCRSAAREDSAGMQPGNAKNRSILHSEKWDASKPPVVGAKVVRAKVVRVVIPAFVMLVFTTFIFFWGQLVFTRNL